MTALYVGLAGALGALARYSVGGWFGSAVPGSIPWGTLAVNLGGSFALGLFVSILARQASSPRVRAVWTVGFCGGFTTFGAFSAETLALFQAGGHEAAVVYAVSSVLGCSLMVLAGIFLAKPFSPPALPPS